MGCKYLAQPSKNPPCVDCTLGQVQPRLTQPDPENWVGLGWSSQPDGLGWVQILKPNPKLYLAVLINYKVPKK